MSNLEKAVQELRREHPTSQCAGEQKEDILHESAGVSIAL